MYCKKCGYNNIPDAHYCARCGAQLEMDLQPLQQPNPVPPGVQPSMGPAVAQTTPKSSGRWWKILLSVAALAIVAVLIAVAIHIATTPVDTTQEAPYSTPYTKGTLIDGTYINDWAGFQFTLPEDYVQQEASSMENATTDVGLYAISYDGYSIAVMFEDLSNSGNITEDFYLNVVEQNIQQSGTDYSCIFTRAGEIHDITVAGEDYRCMDLNCSYEEYGYSMIESLYARKIGHHMCFIILMGDTAEQNEATLALFEPVSETP